MTKQCRTPTSSPRRARRSARRRAACSATRGPTTLLAHVLQSVLAQVPALDAARIDDVIVGCAMPEAEQGMNVARIGLLLAGLPNSVPGMTINRFCSSGLKAVSIAADRIRTGEADVMIAAGTESMSMIPMLGPARDQRRRSSRATRTSASPTAWASPPRRSRSSGRCRARSRTRSRSRRTRRRSPRRRAGEFGAEIAPDHGARERARTWPTARSSRRSRKRRARRRSARRHDAPRASPSCGRCSRRSGSVTAGNSSQMSDGAGASILVSEKRAEGAQPRAARALGRLRGRRRAARDHGHRPDRGDPEGAAADRASRRTDSTGSS